MTNLKVAVRIRPLSQRETNSTSVVQVQNESAISITNLKVPEQNVGDSRERTRRFTFDYCFQPDSTQYEIFEKIEKDVENAIKKRFHSCVLAYGQSSSGKTHTMLGDVQNPGLIPKLCQNIFKYVDDYPRDRDTDKVQIAVSYLEIYNEKVRDLLGPAQKTSEKTASLKVREHPKKGPYVQGLSRHNAYNWETIEKWLEIGKTNRSIAATLTNPYSSRSHSVFTLTFGEGVQLHLVDLAGSEKAGNKRSISTFKEGANINKSLVALGNVISTLAESSLKLARNQRKRFIPYRDSVLTWLLKDTLGGNSKTVLIATVSPSSTCYTETINTLRFGQSAKKIVSCPVVNEDPKEKIIRELQAEIAALKLLLAQVPRFVVNNYNSSEEDVDTESVPSSPSSTPTSDTFNSVVCLNSKFTSLNKNNLNNEFKYVNNLSESAKTPVSPFDENLNELCVKYEKLIPIMDVTTSDNKSTKQVPKMRRTVSIETSKSPNKPIKPFGSLETISSASKERPKRLSQPSILRKGSALKIKPPLPIRKPRDEADKGIVTEVKGPQKQDLTKRPPSSTAKPRSQIVAAVTSRLYGKVKRKEVGTETEMPKPTIEEVPKELSICSNARLRLQELTRQALKAHRRKTVETQTDLFPVLRVKEISTDSDDLKLELAEIKDAQTGTVEVETKEASISCVIENFDSNLKDLKNTFVLTRSCGTQCNSEITSDENKKGSDQPPPTSNISFKKYLQDKTEPSYTIIAPCTANPIYTNALVSEDSLDEFSNNICFPTPDIISNHNSLEQGNLGTDTLGNQKSILEEKYAKCETVHEDDERTNDMDRSQNDIFHRAKQSTTPMHWERLKNINPNPTYATEIRQKSQFEERCQPLKQLRVKFIKPTLIEQECLNLPTTYTPLMKTLTSDQKPNKSKPGKIDSKNEKEQIFTAMSKFMKEATSLMENLNLAAVKLHAEQSYNLEVSISNTDDILNECSTSKQNLDFSTKKDSLEEASTQTSPFMSLNLINTDFTIPANKYEGMIKQSCQKMENCINRIQNDRPCKEKMRIPSSSHSSTCESKFIDEDNSVHSNQTYSDYGSLTRNNLKKYPKCSPSDYLKKLTSMRKKIVEYSRDDFLAKDKF